eukprot:g43398.t1
MHVTSRKLAEDGVPVYLLPLSFQVAEFTGLEAAVEGALVTGELPDLLQDSAMGYFTFICGARQGSVFTTDLSSMDPVIVSYHDSLIRRSDLSLLNPPNWLNDHIIAFAFEYFAAEQYKELSGRVCFISPEVTQFIKCMASQEELAIFLEPLQLAQKSLVFFAVNDNSVQAAGGSHWSLLFYNSDRNCFSHYDSCSNMNESHAREIARKLQHFLGTKSEVPFVEDSAPVQKNSYDCGMSVLSAYYGGSGGEFWPSMRPGKISSDCVGEEGPKQTHGDSGVEFGPVHWQ